MNQNSTPKSLVHLKSEFPFYKTYIDIVFDFMTVFSNAAKIF